MRITVSDISTRESQQTVQRQAIRSWDTIPYLSMLDGLYQDDIFHEQISNLPQEYIKLDEMAKDEEKNGLNIYDFFFEPTHEIICEDIKSTLDFYYSNSATFRRLVNYKVERSINDDVDTNKCEVKISLNYSYENIDGGRGCLSLPFDQNGYPIPPDFHNCVNGITSKKLLLDLFLKHILHDHLNASGEVANVYANVIYKEIDPDAIAHTSSCFFQVTMSGEHELFNVDSVTVPPKSTEQIISEGKEIQRKIFLSSHSSNYLQPVTIHKMDRSIKNIAVTSLLLSSRLAVTSGDYRIKNGNSEGENNFLPVKELQRSERALPEDHPAPNTEPHPLGQVLDSIFGHLTSAVGAPLIAILKLLGKEQELNIYKRGYHELLAFSQTGQWTLDGRAIAAEYMLKGLLVHLSDRLIVLGEESLVSFLSFVRENIQHQYKIYELMARDMLVHPLYFSTQPEPPMIERPLWTKESHYTKVLYEKFPAISGSSFEVFYGKEAIITALEIVSFNRQEIGKSAFNKKKMNHLFKLVQLVIHHLSSNGGDRVLLSSKGIKNNFIIMRHIIFWCAKIKGSANNKKINTIARKIVVNNKFSNGIKAILPKSNDPLILLMKAAINKQLNWAEKYYRAEAHMKEHMQECDVLGLMDTNKMVREAVTGLIHEISDIEQSSWLTLEEQHERQVQALESFKKKVSSMSGGQQFVYGFNKIIQEGLGGFIELSFDLDDTIHHRTTSSLSPAARAGLHLLGTIWNIFMSMVPGFNILAGTSSILNRAVVENSADVCGYVQDIIRIGMEAVPVAGAKFTERASNAKYTGLRFVENKIQRGVVRAPIQKGSNYKIIESIENTDFIYQKSSQKVLELGPEGNDGLYRATGFDKQTYGYYKPSGEGFYRKQASYSPLSTEAPNTIKYGDRELVLTKEPNSETYQATYSDSGKNSAMTFYRSSDGEFYQASGLKGGGLIRHVDKPYSELREGDVGYDEELLDITDDSPLLEDILSSLSEDLYPTSEENIQSIYKKYQSGNAAAGENEVVLCRGTIGPQAENIVSFKTAGGIEEADVEVLPVSAEIAKEQVRSGRIVPEYTTDLSVADRFSREHYLIIVRAKVKYLTRGSVSESGWVMPKNTPVDPVGIIDRTYGNAENIGQANASK
ncbi:TPA: DUF4765 family protein [Salmonella enterica]|nr:DUF4765 family protein [Salmonella enterica]HAK8094513.1 DUF4765 family protein [Salmonella enterica]